MAIRVYNTKYQSLNAEKVAELFNFANNDFCGLVSSIEAPFVYDTGNTSWTWSSDLGNVIKFVGGGINIDYDREDGKSYDLSGAPTEFPCAVWGLDITVPDEINSNITTNNYSDLANFSKIYCKEIQLDNLYSVVNNPTGSPADWGYYEYSEGSFIPSPDTEVQSGKQYYFMLEKEVIRINNIKEDSFNTNTQMLSFEYYGNTLWVSSGRFFIPFCGLDQDGHFISMIFNRDKTGYESFLSARTYYHLLKELGDTFVFRVGGPTKGDVGNLNITDNLIANIKTTNGVNIKQPVLSSVVADSQSDDTSLDNMDNLVLLGKSKDTNEDGSINENGSRTVYRSKTNYKIPIRHGGTSADIQSEARKNLGFTYGTNEPSGIPTNRNGESDIGAVYFKIL